MQLTNLGEISMTKKTFLWYQPLLLLLAVLDSVNSLISVKPVIRSSLLNFLRRLKGPIQYRKPVFGIVTSGLSTASTGVLTQLPDTTWPYYRLRAIHWPSKLQDPIFVATRERIPEPTYPRDNPSKWWPQPQKHQNYHPLIPPSLDIWWPNYYYLKKNNFLEKEG